MLKSTEPVLEEPEPEPRLFASPVGGESTLSTKTAIALKWEPPGTDTYTVSSCALQVHLRLLSGSGLVILG